MRGLAVAAALCAAAAATPAAAQEPPRPAPAARAGTTAPAPAPRPAAKPRDEAAATAAETGAAPPAARPKPVSQGRLIPPEEMPPLSGAEAGTDTGKGERAATSAEPTPPPASSGRLIPPDQMPGGDPSAAPAAPPVPLGPPVPELLRESDFAHAACRLELRRLGTVYREIPAMTDPAQRDCGIARPIEVTEILPGITLMGGAAMRCDTARNLAHWMRDIVLPAASYLPDSPRLTSLSLGTTYQCRGVVGNGASQNLSEHAIGNAIDIASFGFDGGTRIDIAPPADRGDLTVAFQNAVQGAACLFFSTVLGPGSNAAHDNHLHLDIKARRGGFRLCQ